mmetsp:Transcript_10190/g.37731  ORF Transcript_10190/g.37731 Transcript_10190/m.37731 type:complete len:213 (+) Transcript_10190:460-1098(+)
MPPRTGSRGALFFSRASASSFPAIATSRGFPPTPPPPGRFMVKQTGTGGFLMTNLSLGFGGSGSAGRSSMTRSTGGDSVSLSAASAGSGPDGFGGDGVGVDAATSGAVTVVSTFEATTRCDAAAPNARAMTRAVSASAASAAATFSSTVSVFLSFFASFIGTSFGVSFGLSFGLSSFEGSLTHFGVSVSVCATSVVFPATSEGMGTFVAANA